MKNTLPLGLVVGFCCLMFTAPCAAQLQVSTIEKISDNGTLPLLAPTGDFVLVRNAGETGLTQINLTNRSRSLLVSDSDVDGEPVFSDGGTIVVYRTAAYRNHLRYLTIKAVNVHTGEVKEIDEPSRESYAFRFAGGKLKIAKRTTMRTQRLLTDIRPVEHEYVLAVEDDNLVLYDGKVRKKLNPNGENIYLWQHLSPDETKIVYVAINDGCHTFVCDIDGKNVVDLGHYIGAPTWFGNDWIIGQQDEDDGHRMTASRLVAIRPDGTDFQVLPTPQQSLPINPSASRDGKVVFENNGQIYLMQLQ